MKYLILWFCLGVVLACEFEMGDHKSTRKEGEKWTFSDMHYECKNGKVITIGCRTPGGKELKVGEETREDDSIRPNNWMTCDEEGLMIAK